MIGKESCVSNIFGFQLIKFSGVAAGKACTVVLRGSTGQIVDEAERSLHDALSVLSQTVKETRVVLGGGCSETLMSCAVEEAARTVMGKKAIAVESFARALRKIPTILADNAGYDSSDLVSRLRAAHYEGQKDAGLGRLFVCHYPPSLLSLNLSRHVSRYHCLDEKTRCN